MQHNPEKATARAGEQRAADSKKHKQLLSYQIHIPAQVKSKQSGRRAMTISVIVLAKHERRGKAI